MELPRDIKKQIASYLRLEFGEEEKEEPEAIKSIQCGHIVNTTPYELAVVDATEERPRLKGRRLAKAIADLEAEVARVHQLGLTVHPRRSS